MRIVEYKSGFKEGQVLETRIYSNQTYKKNC
jgi:hypothetical protein